MAMSWSTAWSILFSFGALGVNLGAIDENLAKSTLKGPVTSGGGVTVGGGALVGSAIVRGMSSIGSDVLAAMAEVCSLVGGHMEESNLSWLYHDPHKHKHTLTHTHTLHTQSHTFTHTYTHSHTHTCTHTHTHTHFALGIFKLSGLSTGACTVGCDVTGSTGFSSGGGGVVATGCSTRLVVTVFFPTLLILSSSRLRSLSAS